MSPLIFNRPPIKACVGFSSPLNIFTKSPESIVMVQPASPPGKEPLPALPVIRKITFMLVANTGKQRDWGSCGSRPFF